MSSGLSRIIISNCVRAFVQPSVIIHESVHLSNSSECHVDVCNELLDFCLMQLAIACFMIRFSFEAFSLRMLSLCDSFACTSRPCNSLFDQLRLSDVIGSKFHFCNF